MKDEYVVSWEGCTLPQYFTSLAKAKQFVRDSELAENEDTVPYAIEKNGVVIHPKSKRKLRR